MRAMRKARGEQDQEVADPREHRDELLDQLAVASSGVEWDVGI